MKLNISTCPETGRVFLCVPGQDDNLAEVFAQDGRSAKLNAVRIERQIEHGARAALVRELYGAATQEFESFNANGIGASLFHLAGAVLTASGYDLWPGDPIGEFLTRRFAPRHRLWGYIMKRRPSA
jgi:hypothetical protein